MTPLLMLKKVVLAGETSGVALARIDRTVVCLRSWDGMDFAHVPIEAAFVSEATLCAGGYLTGVGLTVSLLVPSVDCLVECQ